METVIARTVDAPTKLEEEVEDRLRVVLQVLREQAWANHVAGELLPTTAQAIRDSGLLCANVPTEADGWGLGVANGRPEAYWEVVRQVARADTSVGQVFQVHSNSLDVINAVGTPDQKSYVYDIVRNGGFIGAWGSERPDSRTTTLKDQGDHYTVSGDKAFATNAGIAALGLLFGAPEDSTDPYNDVLMLIIDATDERVQVVPEWWEPSLAMRATASHKVRFDGLVIPKSMVLGDPGVYLRDHYQIRSLCAFASNFLGTIEGMTELAAEAIAKRGGHEVVPNGVRRMAELRRSAAVLEALLERTGRAIRAGSHDSLELANLYRWVAGEELVRAVDHATALGGSMTMFEGNALAKIVVDVLMYVRHENNDRLAETVGKSALEQDVDYNFSGAQWISQVRSV